MAAAWLDADWPAPASVRAFTTLRHGAGRLERAVRPLQPRQPHAARRRRPGRGRAQPRTRWSSTPACRRRRTGCGRCMASPSSAVDAAASRSGRTRSRCRGDVHRRQRARHPHRRLPAGAVLRRRRQRGRAPRMRAGAGLAAGVLEATVAAMRTPAGRVLAWLGPAAGPQHYEIGVEVYDAFVSQDWARRPRVRQHPPAPLARRPVRARAAAPGQGRL